MISKRRGLYFKQALWEFCFNFPPHPFKAKRRGGFPFAHESRSWLKPSRPRSNPQCQTNGSSVSARLSVRFVL